MLAASKVKMSSSEIKKMECRQDRAPDVGTYSWFSHDVTKIQTKKLSILPRFYFHGALEQLKTNFHTNFRFKRVLGFCDRIRLNF